METFAEAILKKRESEGKLEGKLEGERGVFERMRRKGMSFEQIADMTDTPVEELRRIFSFAPAGA